MAGNCRIPNPLLWDDCGPALFRRRKEKGCVYKRENRIVRILARLMDRGGAKSIDTRGQNWERRRLFMYYCKTETYPLERPQLTALIVSLRHGE